jgi:hypothetical protein
LEHKLIIKELLFHGAQRDIRSDDGKTAIEIIDGEKDLLTKEQYRSLRIILTDQSKETECFPRH